MSGIKELYEIDEEGIFVDKRLGKRAFIFELEPWTSLVAELSRTLGTSAKVILFSLGKAYGSSAALEEKAVGGGQELTIDALALLATHSGWGEFRIPHDSSKDLTVKVERCVFCAAIEDPNEKHVPCYFLRGVISGFVDVVLGPNKIEQAHCEQDYCEFRVTIDN